MAIFRLHINEPVTELKGFGLNRGGVGAFEGFAQLQGSHFQNSQLQTGALQIANGVGGGGGGIMPRIRAGSFLGRGPSVF